MPAPKRLLSRLAAFNNAEGILSPRDRIVIGVSGGPDSVCLAHHLRRIADAKNLKLQVLHIHHGLRGAEADRDVRFVKKIAEQFGIPFAFLKVRAGDLAAEERRSTEDAARVLRYRALGAFAHKHGFNKVAVGHHADDQAETLILHLLRGKKAKGLGGIAVKRVLEEGGGKVMLVRPLLDLSRKEIRSYLKAYGLQFRTDSSNTSERFTRNWVRKRVIPLLEKRNPGIRANLLAIAADIRKVLFYMLLLFTLFSGQATAQGVPVAGDTAQTLRVNDDREGLIQLYHRKVQHYNAIVMGSGNTQDPEALLVKKEIHALKTQIDALPPQETKAVTQSSHTAVTLLTPDLPKSPGSLRETFLLLGAIGGLALIGYGLGWGGEVYKGMATAVIKCPTCSKKLRVPKRGKRIIKVRCPECGVQCAYNPKKGGN